MEQIKENDILFSLDLNKLFRILTVLEKGYGEDLNLNEDNIGQKCVMDWFYKDRSAFWDQIVDDWSNRGKTESMTDKERNKEYVNLLLEMEYKNEIDTPQKSKRRNFCEKIANFWLKEDKQLKEDNKKEYVILMNIFLEMEHSSEIELPENLTFEEREKVKIELDDIQERKSRTVDEIIAEISRKIPKPEEYRGTMKYITEIVNASNAYKSEFKEGIKSIVERLKNKNDKMYETCEIFSKKELMDPYTNITINNPYRNKGATLEIFSVSNKNGVTLSERFF